MKPISIIKFFGAWFCIVGAVVVLVIGHMLPVMAEVLAMLAIAFALAPATFSGA